MTDSPELRLLLACLRYGQAGEAKTEIRELCGIRTLNWNALTDLAAAHGMTLLLCRCLAECCPDLLSPETLQRLQDLARRVAHHNLLLTREMTQALTDLSAEGIPAIVYKGPVLALTAYGNIASRGFSDIDLLVSPQDAVRATEVLAARGYAPERALTGPRLQAYIRHQYELRFVRHPSVIELHWSLAPSHFRFGLELSDALARSQILEIAGVPVRTFGYGDTIVALCVHGGRHLWSRLVWVCDIAAVLHGAEGADWAAILVQADRLGARRMLLLGVMLAHELSGVPIPHQVQNAAQGDPVVGRLSRRTISWLRGETPRPEGLFENFPIGRYHLNLHERFSDRMRYLWRLPTTPSAEDFDALPQGWVAFHRLLRPFRLSAKYAGFAIKKLTRSRG